MAIPPISLRDINADLSQRSAAVGGTAWMDGGGWTVTTGGGQSSPVNASSETPGLTSMLAGAAGGDGSAWARFVPLMLGALLALAVLRAVGR